MSNEVNLSSANQAYLSKVQTTQSNSTEPTQSQVEEKKNGKKLLVYGTMALAAIGVASVAIYKHKNPTKAVQDLDFNKGIASFKGKKYSGKATRFLKNGDKITQEYSDGVLTQITRKGKQNFVQKYTLDDEGNRILTVIKDGKEQEVINISQLQARNKQVQNLLSDETLNSSRLTEEMNSIKNKTKAQQDALQKKLDALKKTEAEKVRAEKLAKEQAEKFKKSFNLFKDGIALNNDGQPFTGIIEKTLKNGDVVAMEYSDGILKTSTRTGKVNVVKKYSTNETGEKLVEITRDGKTETRNITQGSNEIKAKLQKQKQDAEKLAKEQADKLAKEQAEKLVKEKESTFFDMFLKEGYSKEDSQQLARFLATDKLGEDILRNKGFVEDNGKVALGHIDAYSYNHILHNEDWLPTRAKLLDIAFKHLKPIDKPITVYRGYKGSQYQVFLNNLRSKQVGDTFVDKGFAYSSFKKDVGEYWRGNDGVMFTINVPKGAKVSRAIGSEQAECLFPRNAEFRIVDKIQDGKITNFIVDYILPQ